MTLGLHLADPFRDPISSSSLFWRAVSTNLAFFSLFLSLVRKISFTIFVFFSPRQKLIFLTSFSLWHYIVSLFKKQKTKKKKHQKAKRKNTMYWFYFSKICAAHCSLLCATKKKNISVFLEKYSVFLVFHSFWIIRTFLLDMSVGYPSILKFTPKFSFYY